MKKAIYTLAVTAALATVLIMAGTATAAERRYVDILINENPPAAIEWSILFMQVLVWEEGNTGNRDRNTIYPSLGSSVIYSNHVLQGSPNMWNAFVAPGSQRVYGYDGKWYLISWQSSHHWYIPSWLSNWTELEVDFSWQLDPNQQ